jgi:hypothetical protein
MGILDGIYSYASEKKIKLNLYAFSHVMKQLNAIGGAMILDVYTRAEIKQLTQEVLDDLIEGRIQTPKNYRQKIVVGE